MKKTQRHLALYLVFFVSSFAFWIPGICIQAYRGRDYYLGRYDGLVMAASPVLLSLLIYYVLTKTIGTSLVRPVCSFLYLYGIWALGLLGSMAAASFSGGGFTQEGILAYAVKGVFLYPQMTWVAATHNGSLGALVLVTAWLVISTLLQIAWSWSKGSHNKA